MVLAARGQAEAARAEWARARALDPSLPERPGR
jgi:hypothetical protein